MFIDIFFAGRSWAECITYTLIFTHLAVMGVTIFLHRSQAHKSIKLHPIVSHFFRFILWLTTGMVTKEWVAVHRKHHATCETAEDPHSPAFYGIWNVLFLGAILYVNETSKKQTMEEYGKGTPDDWIERNLYSKFNFMGIMLLLSFNAIHFGVITGLVIWLIQMYWIPFWAAGVVNGIGHYFGYRTFCTKDDSTNILPIGLIMGGEEHHNNHHAFPRSAKFSFKWWEFDIGWGYITIFKTLGLAKVIEQSPACEADKIPFTINSALALFSAKMRSLRKYEQIVLYKIVQENTDELKALMQKYKCKMRNLKKLFYIDQAQITGKYKQMMADIMQNKALNDVYQMKQKLIENWQGAGFSVAERMEKMKKWCEEAEKQNITHLNKFVTYLKSKTKMAS